MSFINKINESSTGENPSAAPIKKIEETEVTQVPSKGKAKKLGAEQKENSIQQAKQKNEVKKTKAVAEKGLRAPVVYPTQATVQRVPNVDIATFYDKSSLEKLEPQLMQNMRQYAHGLMSQVKSKSPVSPEFTELKKKIFKIDASLSQEGKTEALIKTQCALYYVLEECLAMENVSENNNNVAPQSDVIRNLLEQKRLAQEALNKIALKRAASENALVCLGLNATFPLNDPKRFTCAALAESWSKQEKAKNASSQKCSTHAPRFKKALKQKIKEKIKEKVSSDLKAKSSSSGPLSFPVKIAYESFKQLLKKVQESKDPHFDTQFALLNETCYMMDIYCKHGGLLASDMEMKSFYHYCSRKGENQKFALYEFSEEYLRKKSETTELNKIKHLVDLEVVKELEHFLFSVVSYLENKVEVLKSQEQQQHRILASADVDAIIQLSTNYLIKLIKIHKNLSFSRFIDLFTVHQSFINRLEFALSQFSGSSRDTIQRKVEEILSPQVTLIDTKRHRSTQARHDKKFEALSIRKHEFLDAISPYIHFLTSSDNYNMLSYECSHVVPFPALFARRFKDISEKPLMNGSLYKNGHVTPEYLAANPTKRQEMFASDVAELFQKYKEDPIAYVDNVLELIMKLALEESSHTIHMPSVFNQEVDGASEKYISLTTSQIEEWETLVQFQTINKQKQAAQTHTPTDVSMEAVKASKAEITEDANNNNTAMGANEETVTLDTHISHYTEKVYKYVLGINVFKMIQEKKTLQFSEVLIREQNYIHGVKLSLARKLTYLVSQPQSLTNLLMAYTLCNVFYGLKNAEAHAYLDFTEGEQEVIESFALLEKWLDKQSASSSV